MYALQMFPLLYQLLQLYRNPLSCMILSYDD
jgi:hypothetical protein